MSALRHRLRALEQAQQADTSEGQQLPAVLPADATEAELEDARRFGRLAFRDGDPTLFDEFV